MAKKTIDINDRIIDFVKSHPNCSSSEIHAQSAPEISYATVKRVLQLLLTESWLISVGKLKGTKYQVNPLYEIIRPIDVDEYFTKEIDQRQIRPTFNHDLITQKLPGLSLFTAEESAGLNELQKQFTENISKLTSLEYNKELERLAIDLSWKSSQIEGNTYSLLETEKLLKEQETASGRTRNEATMLLNHKDAIDFMIANPNYIIPVSVAPIEDIHSLLVKELNISRNIRNNRVGISGTNYKPMDNAFQIKEALTETCKIINNKTNVFEKALLMLVLLSYIQPFGDGNKRTARIISNGILLHYKFCPISFRTVDSIAYKKAMLIFYEQNNISPIKNIFIDQYAFAVNTYF